MGELQALRVRRQRPDQLCHSIALRGGQVAGWPVTLSSRQNLCLRQRTPLDQVLQQSLDQLVISLRYRVATLATLATISNGRSHAAIIQQRLLPKSFGGGVRYLNVTY